MFLQLTASGELRLGRVARLFLVRGPGPEFSERDRALLTLQRPHVYQAYLVSERRRHPVPDLTPRKWELMRLVAAGRTNIQIARQLGLSEVTVRTHLENIYGRLDVSNRTSAVLRAFPDRVAYRRDWVSQPDRKCPESVWIGRYVLIPNGS
jgi:DNA-binding CsgD family transcriptional regulator